MFKSSIQTIEQFKEILRQLPNADFIQKCPALSDATIGQHTRHLIELYQCLISGYDDAEVSYDKRKRDKRIETDVDFALVKLGEIQDGLKKPNKALKVSYELGEDEVWLESNYNREVMYNLEHSIHHYALIKVGLKLLTTVNIPDSFGVAPSTIQYRNVCAQ